MLYGGGIMNELILSSEFSLNIVILNKPDVQNSSRHWALTFLLCPNKMAKLYIPMFSCNFFFFNSQQRWAGGRL